MELEVVDDYDPDAWLLTLEEFETLSPREQRRYLRLLARAAEEWVLLPRQQDADRLADKVDCLLFGGSAGPGKSTWLLHRAARLSIKHPKHTTLMLRRTFPELKRSLIRKSILWYAGLPSEHRPTWRAGEKEWWFPNGSIIEFGHCETDDDTQIYLSAEYDMIVFDEQTQFTEDQYTMVRSRARTTRDKMRDGVHPHVIGATNPGQVGHSWNKRDFVDATNYGTTVYQRDLADPKDPERVATLSFAYVHSTVRDNPHMDEGYVRNLLSLPDVKRAQYLDGDWDVFAGMFFADDFDRSVHVVDSMPEEWGGLPPEAWPQVYAIDFGTAAPWAALWGVWDNDGCLWVWHEEYGPRLIPSEQATTVKKVEARRKSQFGVGDPSMWKQSHRSAGVGQTIADQYSEHGVYLLPAKNERVAGWGRVRDYLRRDSYGVPGIRIIGSACPNLVRTLPEQVTDSVNPEDIDTDGEDHAVDALRYLCMTRDRKYRPAAPVSTSLVDEIDARRDKKRRKRKQPSW